MTPKKLKILLLGTLIFTFSNAASSDEYKISDEPPIVILGAAQVPEFSGSEDVTTVPLVFSRFRLYDRPAFITGTQFRLGLYETNHWQIGPLIGVSGARDDSVTNVQVARMTPVELSFESGLFARYATPMGQLEEGLLESSASITAPFSGDWNGSSLTVDVAYSWAVSFMWRVAVEGAVTFMDSDYAMSRYGVNEVDSQLSGLPTYTAEGGVKDATVGIRSILSFSPTLALFTSVGYSQLLSDAKDSPIVTETGTADQWVFGVGIFKLLSK